MTFSALLLAGGESRRMGRDKATIEFGGQPLWQKQLQLLQALGPKTTLVSARTVPGWVPDDVEVLLDDQPSRGPLSGLAKALSRIETTYLVVLAVDMPFMTAGEFRRSLELVTEGCGVVPIIGDRAEPLAAIYPTTAASDFRDALAGPDVSVQSVVRKLAEVGKVKLWPVRDARTTLYKNVNEPSGFKEGRF